MNNILKTVLYKFALVYLDDIIIFRYGIGAVLAQIQTPPQSADFAESDEQELRESDGVEVVIAYTSKHLNDREAKWSTTEKEAYAIIHAIEVFRTYLYGRRFTVYTDHRPLEWLMSKTEPAGRLARWALKIQEFDIVIGYRPGKSHQNADTLSRTPIVPIAKIETRSTNAKTKTENKACTENMEIDRWINHQNEDEYCGKIIRELETGNPHSQCRRVVPKSMVRELLEVNHDSLLAGHLGIQKTIDRILRQYTWPNLDASVKEYVKSCLICSRRKAIGGNRAPLLPLPPVEGKQTTHEKLEDQFLLTKGGEECNGQQQPHLATGVITHMRYYQSLYGNKKVERLNTVPVHTSSVHTPTGCYQQNKQLVSRW
ncbi:hypothetical protein GHT06_015208 [Daphnia sinensis]|uniref:RNA-directed DNA polymerase n=1 Tax=Daphnia sinensis TaxID=1820382 RepID=A0AAD5LAM7_9CRUS|nr:hypothetical protein GHT06_015208 [Daphnia sinensis]